MATVRIYKVAELLNTSSQEVMALLKRDHGIEVKSASSTIEEVVARQFVDRLARQREHHVPSNALVRRHAGRLREEAGRQGAGTGKPAPVAAAAATGQERQAGARRRHAPAAAPPPRPRLS